MKKLISFVLALVLLLTAMPLSFVVSAETSGTTGDCTWLLDGTVLTISGNGAMQECSWNTAPWGKEVTKVIFEEGVKNIPSYAFYQCNMLTSVTLSNTITSIGDSAFAYCKNIESVIIPQSVKSIGRYAFSYCEKLSTITLPNTAISIDLGAFGSTAYYNDSNNWEDGLLYIGNHLVSTNLNSSSVTIKPGTITIAEEAFRYDTDLTSITIPDSVVIIGENAFNNTGYYNNAENWENDVLYIDNHLIKAKDTVSGDYNVKEGTVSLSNSAFYWCQKLTSINLPDSVTTIGDDVFYYCSALTNVTLGSGLKNIGKEPFHECSKFENIDVALENTEFCSENGILYNKNKTALVLIPYGYKKIDIYKLPSTVTTIKSNAVSGAYNIEVFIFSDNNVVLEDSAFNNVHFETIYISKTLTGMNNAFKEGNIRHTLYSGTEAEWQSLGYNNIEAFKNSDVCFSAKSDDFYLTHKANPECGRYDSDYYYCNICNKKFDYDFEMKYHQTVVIETFEPRCTIGYTEKSQCTECGYIEYVAEHNGPGHNFVDGVCTKCNTTDEWEYRLSPHNDGGYEGIYIYNYKGTNPNPIVPETIEGYPVCQLTHISFSYDNNLLSVKAPTVTSIAYTAFRNSTNLTAVTIPKAVKSIRQYTFYNCSSLNHIYYGGSEQEWNNVEVSEYGNQQLENVKVHYNTTGDELQITEISPATCTKGGEYKFTCTVCNDVFYGTSEPLGHTKGELVGEEPATCTTVANDLYDCVRCDYVISEPTKRLKNHTFVDGECTDCSMLEEDCIESKHDYDNESYETWTITKPGAKKIKIVFSPETCTEKYSDYIYIYDGNGNYIGSYSGDGLASQAIMVNGDTVKITLSSGYSGTAYGFKVHYLKAYYSTPGDINTDGDVTLTDVVTLAQHLAEWDVECDEDVLDVNGDGSVALTDVVHLAQYLAEWDGIVLN